MPCIVSFSCLPCDPTPSPARKKTKSLVVPRDILDLRISFVYTPTPLHRREQKIRSRAVVSTKLTLYNQQTRHLGECLQLRTQQNIYIHVFTIYLLPGCKIHDRERSIEGQCALFQQPFGSKQRTKYATHVVYPPVPNFAALESILHPGARYHACRGMTFPNTRSKPVRPKAAGPALLPSSRVCTPPPCQRKHDHT